MNILHMAMAAFLATSPLLEPSTVNALVRFYSSDSDASIFICGQEVCDYATVMESTEARCEAASESLSVCFIEPKKKARNFYTGVVVKPQLANPSPQFVFFGSGIRVGESLHNGVRDVVGREVGEDGATIDYRFCWSGERYVETCVHAELNTK